MRSAKFDPAELCLNKENARQLESWELPNILVIDGEVIQ